MRRQLPFILTFLLVLGASSAKAQFALTVLEPAAIAGIVPNTVGPNDDWGFGPANALAPVTGFCQWASPDTLALNAANVTGPNGVGDLTGKVAVVRRGTILRSIKARRVERAGAIACIIINDNNAPPSILAEEDSGVLVRIPVILVPKSWGDANRALIGTGTVRVQIGNVRGFYDNNLVIDKKSLFTPKNFAVPANLVADTGDYGFPVGGSFLNYGRQPQGSSIFKAEVRRVEPNPARLWADSVSVAGVSLTDSLTRNFPKFDLVRADPSAARQRGHYQLVYTLTTAGTPDQNPTDNEIVYDFYLTANSFSASRLQMDASLATYMQPPANIAYTLATGGSFKWGQYLRTGSAGDTATDVTFAVTTNDATPLAGQTVDAELYKWVDANADGSIDDTEVTILGIGSQTYTTDTDRYVFKTVRLQDIVSGEDGIVLEPFSRYLFMVSYAGVDQVFVAAAEEPDYTQNFENDSASTDWYFPLYNGTNWSVFGDGAGGFASSLASIRVDFGSLATSNRRVARLDSRLSAWPNPAAGQVWLTLQDQAAGGPATLRLRDLTGCTVLQRSEVLQGAVSRFTLPLQGLAPGIYQVEATAAQGTASQKLVITK